ncbi:MAG: TrbI F-type domain-containing protein [Pseudomonadota bacterium]
MTDLFESAGMELKTDPPRDDRRLVATRRFVGMTLREILLLLGAIAIFIWGAWVTKNLLAEESGEPEFVQLQLQGIISEYLTAQARSSADEQTAAQQTSVFMTTLDQTVAGLAESGKVVLVHEAVIGGDIPDVTESVKAAVYATVPRPQIAQAPSAAQPSQRARVQGEMQAFMASNEEGEGDGAR